MKRVELHVIFLPGIGMKERRWRKEEKKKKNSKRGRGTWIIRPLHANAN